MKKYIQRLYTGKKANYFLDEQQIAGAEDVKYLNSLGIPPAWKDVKISTNRRARIQATGIDKAGRLQYIYHPAFRARQEKEKFERILRFADALPHMRRVTDKHLAHPILDKQKVLACIVQLMDQSYFRVGNKIYAEQNQSYGLTTLRSKHTEVKRDTIIFDFVGKSGQPHLKKITDKKLVKVIKGLDDLPGYEIFKYYGDEGQLHNIDSQDVNDYIKEIMGEEFSAKDFRTWGGTVMATAHLSTIERSPSVRERKMAVTGCVKHVASKLGNTPAVTRSSYIDPRVIAAYMNGHSLARVRETVEKIRLQSNFSRDEHCLIELLRTN